MLVLAVLTIALSGPAARAGYINPAIHGHVQMAVQICETDIRASASGSYTHFPLSSVIIDLTTVRSLVEATRAWQMSLRALGILNSLEHDLDSNLAEAQSGRWNAYSLQATADLMASIKAELLSYQRASEGTFPP